MSVKVSKFQNFQSLHKFYKTWNKKFYLYNAVSKCHIILRNIRLGPQNGSINLNSSGLGFIYIYTYKKTYRY